MAQETAVDWLHSLHKKGILIEKSFEMAKEIEKEQMIKFAETMPKKKGVTQEGQPYVQYDAEEHYNETYNK